MQVFTEAVFETNHTLETEMGESCEKKLILQAQNKITILCFVVDLLEMQFRSPRKLSCQTVGGWAGRLVVIVQNSSWNLSLGTGFQPQWLSKNE